MRLLIGIDLAKKRGEFKELQRELKFEGLNAVKTFHLTLGFIGEVEDQKLPIIVNALERIRLRKFELRLKNIYALPDLKTPEIIALGLENLEEINKLRFQIREKLGNTLPLDKQVLSPHVTLLRVKDFQKAFNRTKDLVCETELISFEVKEFVLIQSQHTGVASGYKKLKRFKLI